MRRKMLVLLSLSLAACASVRPAQQTQTLYRNSGWAVIPFANYSETPQAGMRAAAIASGLLAHKGISKLAAGTPAGSDNLLDNDMPNLESSLEWAKSQGARYALTGAVHEWRYKVGLDGEPAVGLTMQLVEVSSGKIIWSAVGAKRGWGHMALSAVGVDLSEELLASITLQ